MGDLKAYGEAITGNDLVTGQRVDSGERAATALMGFAMLGAGSLEAAGERMTLGSVEGLGNTALDMTSKTQVAGDVAKTTPSFYVSPDGVAIPATAYRYMDSKYASKTMGTMEAPLSCFGFEKYATGKDAQNAFQIAPAWGDARLRGTFDTLQLFSKEGEPLVKVPLEAGGAGPLPEPFTRSYPEYGDGGAYQLVPISPGMRVRFDDVTLLPP